MFSATLLSMTYPFQTAHFHQSSRDVGVVNSDAHVDLVSIQAGYAIILTTAAIDQTRPTAIITTVDVTSSGLFVAGLRIRVITLTGPETVDRQLRMLLDRCLTTPMEHLQVTWINCLFWVIYFHGLSQI
jgi:hypothetical protein